MSKGAIEPDHASHGTIHDMDGPSPLQPQEKKALLGDLEPRALVASILRSDPLLLEAAEEVDLGLIRWFLGLSPFERLQACTNATRALGALRDGPPPGS